MNTKVYILASIVLFASVLGGAGPEIVLGHAPNDPPARKGDGPKHADDDDADGDRDTNSMGGPKNPKQRKAQRDQSDEGDASDDSPRRRRGDGMRRGFRGPGRERGFHGRGPDRDRVASDEPISPELEADAMKLLETRIPEMYQKMAKLRDEKNERFHRVLRKIMPMIREFKVLQDAHPEMADVVIEEFKTERSVRFLAKRYMDARRDQDADAQARLEGEFRELMKRRHELEMQRRQFRLDDFRRRLQQEQARLDEEASRLEEDQSGFETELERRVQRLREGKFRDAFGPPPGAQRPGDRRRGGRFDGPPHRGRGLRGMEGPPRRRGPDGRRPPPRERDDGDPERPDDDLDI